MHIFCMFQPPLSKNTWFTLFVGQELVRHMHFLGSPRSGKTCISQENACVLHVSAASKNACCCMLLHVAACLIHFFNFSRLHSKKHAFSQAKYHVWWDWTFKKCMLQNACCKGAPPHTVVVPQSTPGSLSCCHRCGFSGIASASTYVCQAA